MLTPHPAQWRDEKPLVSDLPATLPDSLVIDSAVVK